VSYLSCSIETAMRLFLFWEELRKERGREKECIFIIIKEGGEIRGIYLLNRTD